MTGYGLCAKLFLKVSVIGWVIRAASQQQSKRLSLSVWFIVPHGYKVRDSMRVRYGQLSM